jgi:hypothetical protein
MKKMKKIDYGRNAMRVSESGPGHDMREICLTAMTCFQPPSFSSAAAEP